MRFLTLIVAVFTLAAMAAPPKKVVIQTNAICAMCKTNIETALSTLEGVVKAELDLVTKKVKIKYDEDIIDVATLRQAIANTGYTADEVPARPKAREALAFCCRKDVETKTGSAKSGKNCATSCTDKEGA